MSEITYPKQYSDPKSREGVKFKYYKVEPFDIHKKNDNNPTPSDTKPKIEIDDKHRSGRIDYALSDMKKMMHEVYDVVSFEDIIDECLDEHVSNTNK